MIAGRNVPHLGVRAGSLRLRRLTDGHRYGFYVARRLAFLPVGLLIVVTISFFVVNLVPSDPARIKVGGLASESELESIRAQLGLNHSVGDRYVQYVGHLLRGDLGRSFYSGRPVIDDIELYLPSTIELIVLALVVAVLLGSTIGAISAYFDKRPADSVARFFVSLTQAVPDFFLGLLLVFVLSYHLKLTPLSTGQLGLLDPTPPHRTGAMLVDSLLAGQWGVFRSAVSHAILPVLTLGIYYSAYFAKTARAVLVEALDSNQVEFARALGLSERRVLAYAFRSGRTQILTYVGVLFSSLIGAAAIVEIIFAWNGIGQFAVDRILHADLPEIQGFMLVAGFITLLVFLVLDLVVVRLDPRVKLD